MKSERFKGLKEKGKKILEWFKSLKNKIGSRTIAGVCAVMLVGCAVALNFLLFRDGGAVDEGGLKPTIDLTGITDENVSGDSVEAGASAEDDLTLDEYFATVSLGRQQARDEAVDVLLEVSENDSAEASAREAAMADINRIALDIERESNIETMVTAKGFEKCVAVVNGDTANVIVSCDTLTPGETAQISEIVYEAAGILPVNLKIIERGE
ncbi:MAG: SpoIIIAH-like family protein [Clostridia bacterium]|nr:SpoIIIAH-like family protein [Clostridia bacterium]